MYKLKVEYLNGTKVTYTFHELTNACLQMKREEEGWNYPVKSIVLKYSKEETK